MHGAPPANSISLTVRVERRGLALHLTLDCPANRNAMSPGMTEELLGVCAGLATDPARCVVLRGAGGTFCSGGDIRRFIEDARTESPATAADPVMATNRRFGRLLQYLDAAPQVIVALVEGAAYGGGCGLACVSDIVIAHAEAKFSLSETTLGVIPAQIAPFVVRRLGLRNARRLALTGARFSGRDAERYGLIDILCDSHAALEAALNRVLKDVLACAPAANAATKRLLGECGSKPVDVLLDEAARAFAQALRFEGREGAAAYVEKRRPAWADEVS